MRDVEEHHADVDVCVVAFASGGGDFAEGVPHFEFGRFLGELGVARVLIRDSTGFSCQYGVLGIGDRVTVCCYLAALRRRYRRVVLIGLSVGAMAALMYGQLASMDEVIALSPYSALGQNADAVFGGAGWESRTPFGTEVPLLIDLRSIFADGPTPRVRAFVSDGEGTSEDRWHAERIGVTDVTLVPGSSHAGLARLMRDSGALRAVILGDEA